MLVILCVVTSFNDLHTLAYTYFGTVFKGVARLLEEIIHSRQHTVQKFVQKIVQVLSDLSASFTLIAF